MPKAWLCIPAARDEGESTVSLWREAGYGVALFRDEGAPHIEADVRIIGKYPGYAQAVNELCHEVLVIDKDCLFCVAGGDDVCPDTNYSPDQIVSQLVEHFSGTFGVCQFTGDRFGESANNPDPAMRSAYIDRVCGSPWIGREFARRINQGKGPLWPEYFHMGEDEELFHVAQNLGVLWHRPDLTHFHQHWGRPREGERMAPSERMPAFLKRANSGEEWAKYKKLFAERKAAGFPGSDPI